MYDDVSFFVMVYFNQMVIDEIITAANEQKVREIIDNSLSAYQGKNRNTFFVRMFLMNMTMDLEALNRHTLSSRAVENVDTAIQIFRTLHRQRHENIL